MLAEAPALSEREKRLAKGDERWTGVYYARFDMRGFP
jgi:hypothetical protein